jgi:hypothetical protein
MQINRDFFPLKLKKWFGVLQVYPIMHNILLYDSGVDCIKKSREIDRDHGSRFPLPSMFCPSVNPLKVYTTVRLIHN